MNYPKVSVVVPIYKVEKYLDRCIKSILNQTYANIEVILVNDGSPDRSGEIAENYAELDNRVKVVHKDNGGLSDARNAGMHKVTGEYTVFVDSDDWIDSKMIGRLVNTCQKYQADIVQSAFYYAYDDHLLFDNRFYFKEAEPIVLDRKSLMHELIRSERVKNFAWGKLYKTSLIKDMPFKKGVLFEDVFWAYHVMHRVESFVLINQPLYFYVQRNDSIVATYSPRNLDILLGLKLRHQFIETHYHELADESYKELLKASLIHYNMLLVNWRKDKDGVYKQEIRSYICENYKHLKKAVKQDHDLSRQLNLFCRHPLLNVSYLMFTKLLKKLRILPCSKGLKRIEVSREGELENGHL